MAADLSKLYPAFREKAEKVVADMNAYAGAHMLHYNWRITDGYRSVEEQKALYAKGRTRRGQIVTYADGVKRKSKHQYSMAVDIAPFHGYTLDYKVADAHWRFLGHVARSHGLEWGGDWEKIRDMPHVQWPERDKAAYAKALAWQKENGL